MPSPFDRDAAADAIVRFLKALGKEPEGALANTPELVAEAWCRDLLEGEGVDAEALLAAEAID
ncbi:MAG: GTP cyclohydrolase, partial [Polyangiaceae bacterium]